MNTIKSAPYRPAQFLDSFDENDAAKAMAFRNAKFDEGVNTVQASVNAIAQLPTITESDKEYLHSKIATLVTKSNSATGLDLSNSMNVKALESEALDIYNDSTIVDAVTSAKNYQNQAALITKYKTDPKLNANYGIANEDDFNGQLLNHKKLRAEGKSSTFTYQYKNFFDVDGNLQKDIKKLQTDAYTELKGMYFNKVEEITPERIQAIVNNKISADPRYADQIKINAAFKYKTSTLDDLIHEKNQEQREQYQNLIISKNKSLDGLMAGVSDNPTLNKKLIQSVNTQIDQNKSYLKQLQDDPNAILFNILGKEEIKHTTTLDRKSLEYNLTASHLLKQMQGTYSAKKQNLSYNPAILAKANYEANRTDAKNDEFWRGKEFELKNQVASWHHEESMSKAKVEADKFPSVLAFNPITETTIQEDPEKFFNDEIVSVKDRTVNSLTSFMFERLNQVGAINPYMAHEFLSGAFSKEGIPGEIQFNSKNLSLLQKAYEEGGDGTHKQIISKTLVEAALKTLKQISIDGKKAWTENGAEVSAKNINAMNGYIQEVQTVRSLRNQQVKAENQAIKEAGITKEQWKLIKSDVEEYEPNKIVGWNKVSDTPIYQTPFAKSKDFNYEKYAKAKSTIKEILGKQTEQIQRGYVQYFDPKAPNYDVLNNIVLSNIQNKQSEAGSGDPNGLSITSTTFGKQIKFNESIIDPKDIETTFYDSRQNKVYMKIKVGSGDEATTQTLSFPMALDKFPQGFISNKLLEANQPMSITKSLNYDGRWSAKGNPQEDYIPDIDHAIKTSFRKVNPKDVTDDRVYVTVKPDIKGFVGTQKEFPSAEYAKKALTGVFQNVVKELNQAVKEGKISVKEKNERIIKIIETL